MKNIILIAFGLLLTTGCATMKALDRKILDLPPTHRVFNPTNTYLDQNLKMGMTQEQVIKILGLPDDVSVTQTKDNWSAQWVYEKYLKDTYGLFKAEIPVKLYSSTYVYFENGKLDAWQN